MHPVGTTDRIQARARYICMLVAQHTRLSVSERHWTNVQGSVCAIHDKPIVSLYTVDRSYAVALPAALRKSARSKMSLSVSPCACAEASTPQRQAQHSAARLRTKHFCDIATLAWDAKLEGLVREACPSALALDWSPEVDPEVVRWQAEVCNHSCTDATAVDQLCMFSVSYCWFHYSTPLSSGQSLALA